MKTDLFHFDLPPDRIATYPVNPRDNSRMLIINNNIMNNEKVSDLPDYLQKGDVLVLNDTRVIPGQIRGTCGERSYDLTLHKALGEKRWLAFIQKSKKLRSGDKIVFSNAFSANVIRKHESGEVELGFECDDFHRALKQHGSMPLPHYMKRVVEVSDNERYQTIYGSKEGAVAAPTAGLHFTEELFARLDARGVRRVYVTLHVGAGTFQPVKVEDTENHPMHSEYAEISCEVAEIINAARQQGNRIVAVGTTSLRTLESAADEQGVVQPMNRETRLFITPGYRFKIVDVLMTNFHLPRSTLFMLVSAFAGLDVMKEAYAHAIAENYRFYSYGDACLIYPQKPDQYFP